MRVGDKAIWYRYTGKTGVLAPKEKFEVEVTEVQRLRVKIRLPNGSTRVVLPENLQLIRNT